MTYRQFQDRDGRAWEAWDVHPSTAQRMLESTRTTTNASEARPVETHAGRVILPPELQDGWLAFQSGLDARRLAPIPMKWQDLSDFDLASLAETTLPSRRRF